MILILKGSTCSSQGENIFKEANYTFYILSLHPKTWSGILKILATSENAIKIGTCNAYLG